MSTAGQVVGRRYRVEGMLGSGGAGDVLRVVDVETGRRLALKRLRHAESTAGRRRAEELRFRREYHVLAGLRHPAVVHVHDYGVDRDGPWYTMELLDGPDLRHDAPLPVQHACRIVRDVASALSFLHARRLLHRDVAPRNVRCTRHGDARLIDFGVLSTVGVQRDVAGTPPCIAPEALRRMPLDHRVDLYSLGALAYFLLTGRFAYPAHSLEELDALWEQRPAPPSALREEIASGLDELVLSMLSLDPLGRPASAHEVMDRLGGLADLGPAPEISQDRAAFGSAALVGRRREMRLLRRSAAAAREGRGSAFVVEGPSGIGKSRLLREVALEMKVGGGVAVGAPGGAAGRGPYGVLQELTRALLAEAPDEAVAAAEPLAPQLGRVLPAVVRRLPRAGPPELTGDPGEDRLRVHSALVAWLLDVAERRPLAILVDDVQRSDEASAAVLASLAHAAGDHPILVGSTLRTDEPVRAPTAVGVVSEAAEHLPLRGLGVTHVRRMLRSLFGDVPELEPLAQQLHDAAGGNPLQLLEVARHLVDRGAIRFVDGMWTLPSQVRRRDLPEQLHDALDARVRSLGKGALALGQAIAVHGGELPLEVCVKVLEGDEDRAFGAIDELVENDVLVGSQDRWRIRHDGLRAAFRRTIDPRRLPRLHLTLGRALASSESFASDDEADVGWHLLRGGDPEEGARLLARAGRRLFEAQSFSDAIPPLEEALTVWEREGRSLRDCLDIRHMLVTAGVMADRATLLRYADRTISMLRRCSGLSAAAAIGRVVGRRLGLFAGVAWAGIRWMLSLPSRRGPSPRVALSRFFVSVAYACTAYSVSFDFKKTAGMLDVIAPFAVPRPRVPWACHLLVENFHEIPMGRFASVRERAEEALEILERDRLTPMSDADRVHGQGAAVFMVAAALVLDQDLEHEEWAARLEALERRFFVASARTVRAVYHRLRGEEERAVEKENEARMMFVQLGSVWVLESQRRWASSLAYALSRDLLGLRRSIDGLVALTDEGYRLEAFVELARGEYLRERGELEASQRTLETALLLAPEGGGFVTQAIHAALSETFLALGDADRAAEKAEAGSALGERPDWGRPVFLLRNERALALAEATRGDLDSAASRLDDAIGKADPLGSPTVCGGLHEARARVALAAGDRDAYTEHRDAARRWFRGTRNPALVARADRLVQAGGGEVTGEHAIDVLEDVVTVRGVMRRSGWVSQMLDGCETRGERLDRALEVILQETGTTRGHLYLTREGRLDHVAPHDWMRPPPEVSEALERVVEAARGRGEPEEATVVEAKGSTWHTVLLTGHDGDARVCVGAVVVATDGDQPSQADPAAVDAVVRKLLAHHDVVSTRTEETSDRVE